MSKYMNEIIKVNPELKNESKETLAEENYAHYYWVWFGIFFALGVIMIIITRWESLFTFRFVVAGIILIASIFSSVTIHKLLRLAGKKYGWVLGLIPLITPFGFFISFLIIRDKLKKAGMWNQEGQRNKKIPLVLKFFGIIALIIIIVFWMFLRGERITRHTREEVEKNNVEEISN